MCAWTRVRLIRYGIYRWFVCDRWRTVYEHDAGGNRVRGNLEELKEHVRLGHSLQVGVRQLFGLAEDTADGPSHISFVTTMQPLIRDGHVQSNLRPRCHRRPEMAVHLARRSPCVSDAAIHVRRDSLLPR